MSQSVGYYTQEGLQKLKDELHHLKVVERKSATQAVVEAREKGDLSENAEYDAAREAQALLEVRIAKLEEVIANARVVDESKLDLSKASILTTVKIKNIKTSAQMSYTLVAENEADLKAGKISASSPIGKGLIGKKVGELAEIQAPNGVMKFMVENITV